MGSNCANFCATFCHKVVTERKQESQCRQHFFIIFPVVNDIIISELKSDGLSRSNTQTSMTHSRSFPATSRMSLRSAASTSYALPPDEPTHQSKKPKRSLTFKQRMKNLKDNLLYASDIKYCRKTSNLKRMSSVRSSIRSGRSPYANDYDETDALISTTKKSKQRRPRNRQLKDSSQGVGSRPATTDGRSRTVTPESRSRPPSLDSSQFTDGMSRPVTPLQRSRPPSPDAITRPVPTARSRPPSPGAISPETKSRPTTPVFRQGGKAPAVNYFRPRTPSALDTETTPMYSPTSPNGRNDGVPLIHPVAKRVVAGNQDSPKSSYRSQQTLL